MIRNGARNTVLLAAAALLMSGAVAGCSGKKSGAKTDLARDVGSVTMAIVVGGAEIKKVDYSVTGNGITPITGSVDVTGQATTVSVLINGIPAGKGYTVDLTATAVDGVTTCAGKATFDIEAGKTSSVSVVLQCKGARATGGVAVNATLNSCPLVTSVTVSPLAVDVGGTITVNATAADSDTGDALTYSWSAPAGAFADGTKAGTSYTCSPGGSRTLTLKVTDGKCEDAYTVDVACVAVLCGNGTVDPGEQCDPPNGTTCSAACQNVVICGDGKVEGAEECDPPAAGTCSATCKIIVATPVCGNNVVEAGEQCDPPAAGTCSATCQTIVVTPPTCGDGVVNQASEECDAPSLPTATCSATCKIIVAGPVCGNNVVEAGEQCDPPAAGTCSATCQTIAGNPVCDACLAANCPADIAGCGGLTGTDKTDCEALVACIQTEQCYTPEAGGQPCYCGTATDAACLGMGANGKCKAQVEKAAKSVVGEEIANRFVDPAFPLGRAFNLFGCRAALCSTECQ
jgi:hypothetical protein